ncbi:MAG: hypothetical protein KBT35_00460 [Firmicutes bacterium]|nr:hypothetical protein [Candidatus Colivicinus equi]
MKRVLVVLLSVLMVMALAGCQSISEQIKEDQIKAEKEEKKKNNQLDFNDIAWEAYYGVEDNKRYMLMDIENNSNFVIVDISFTYTEKEDITDEERTTYIKDLAELVNMSVEELHERHYDRVEVSAYYENEINPGDSITTHFYYLHGMYYLMDEDKFNLCVPDYVEIKYIVDGNEVHTTYYDFRTNEQRYSNEIVYIEQ